MELQTGDILFIDSGTILGNMIKKVTKFDYSHVAIVVGYNKIIEITAFTKSKIITLQELEYKTITVKSMRKPLNIIQKNTIENKSQMLINKHYDYRSIMILLMNYVFGLKRDPFKNTMDRVYCTEAIDFLYNATSIDLVKGHENRIVRIDELYNSQELYISRKMYK